MLDLFKTEKNYRLLSGGFWGLEKESIRISPEGNLAIDRTSRDLWRTKLENPAITVDFSESQIEMVTPPADSIEKTYKTLRRIQDSVLKNLKDELLWPFSMPPRLPEESKIPIAKFNHTEMGKKNEIYRQGLAFRYGKKMQMISGIHYNFFFSK